MNLAPLLVALIATTAAGTPGDPVLLDFQATWCGPCREMRPEVDALIKKGYPIKPVDIDRQPELSGRYKVTAVPTFPSEVTGACTPCTSSFSTRTTARRSARSSGAAPQLR